MKEKQRRLRLVSVLLFAGFIGTLLSGAVHELGHALVVALSGAKVNELHLLWIFGPPHIQYTGQLSHQASAWMSASGMLASVGLGAVCLATVPFRRLSPFISLGLGLMVATLLSQSLAWTILPVLVMFGATPQDDVIKFLTSSGMRPALLALAGMLLVVLSAVAFFKRTGFVSTLTAFKKAHLSAGI